MEYVLIYLAFSLTTLLLVIQEERKEGTLPADMDFGMWIFFIVCTILPVFAAVTVCIGIKRFLKNLVKERRWGRGE